MVLRLWDQNLNTWIEKEKLLLSEENRWQGTFRTKMDGKKQKWEVREKDKNGKLVEGAGELSPFMATKEGVTEEQNYTVDYYTDSNYDSLKPCVKITNHGERNMATCVVNLVWEDGEEGVTHEPVSLDVIKAFGPVETRENAAEMRKARETDKDGKPLHPMIPDEEYAGTLKLTSENEWTGTLYTDGQYADNKVFRVDHMIYYLALFLLMWMCQPIPQPLVRNEEAVS